MHTPHRLQTRSASAAIKACEHMDFRSLINLKNFVDKEIHERQREYSHK
jgi:hypothetical protein